MWAMEGPTSKTQAEGGRAQAEGGRAEGVEPKAAVQIESHTHTGYGLLG